MNGLFRCGFAILVEPAISPEPCEGTFDNPTARQQDKAFCSFGVADDFQCGRSLTDQCLLHFLACIACVGKEFFEPRKPFAQPFERYGSSIAILHIGRPDFTRDEVTFWINDDLSLAPFDVLASVNASWSAAFLRLDD